jgi:hypothetical protein
MCRHKRGADTGFRARCPLTAPEATTHFTFLWTGQAVVLGGLASGVANAVLLAQRGRAGVPGRGRRADPRRLARRARHRRHRPLRRRHRASSRTPSARRASTGRYHDALLGAAAFAGGQLVTGGTDPARHNIANPLTASLAGGTLLPVLDTSRLRVTWLAEAAALIGLPTFLHAAGISCSQRLGDITAALNPGSEDQAVRLLGASTR